MKTSHHKIFDSKYICLITGDGEICHNCGGIVVGSYDFGSSDESKVGSIFNITDPEYSEMYPQDVVVNNYIYHLCGKECLEIFQLNLANIKPNADLSSLSEFY